MKFTALRLSGFKSFVDPTELALMPGLTGVVGPNGCGKSNLLEALRWVMGESRAKTMRGDGMEDVIFAGAETRPARNFAEVSLMLGDTAGSAPGQFAGSETLEVARRITRNAGSAFRINGKEMRARDVRVLFADAATGPQSPSLVRQGQIGLLIAAKPQGRRKILEDAAGIAGLYERRREVEQRLRAAEENLIRVDDVLTRLDAQVAGLKRQARQAERYTELTDTIRTAAGELTWLRYRVARDEAAAASSMVDEAQRIVAAATAAEVLAARERATAEDALPPLREEAAVATAVHQRLLSRREAVAADAARATETLTRLERDAARLAEDLGRESELSGDARTAMEALEAERDEMRAIVSDAGAIAAAARAVVDAEAAVTRAEAERDALAAKAAAGSAERKSAERIAGDAAKALSDAETRLASAETRATQTREALAKTADALTDARKTAEQAKATLTDGPERLTAIEAARREAEEAETAARAVIGSDRAALAGLEAEFQRIEKGLAARTGGMGVLSQVRAAPGYELALAAALGDSASADVADGFAPDRRGWLSLGSLGHAPDEGRALSRYVEAPAALARLLTGTAVVTREEGPSAQTRLNTGQRLVSVEGDLWRWDGYFRGGEAGGEDAAALRLQRLNRRDALTAELTTARASLASAQATSDTLAAQLADARKAETDARAALKRNEDAAAQAARILADLDADHARRATAAQQAQDDLTALHAAVETARTRNTEAATAFDRIADPADLNTRAEAAQTALATDRSALATARTHHTTLVGAEERRTERLAAIKGQMDGWRKRASAAEKRHLDVSKRLRETEAELATARGIPEKLATERAGLDGEVSTAATRVTASNDALAAAEGTLRTCATAATAALSALSAAREALARNEATAEGTTARAAEAEAVLREETDASPDDAAERFTGLTDTTPDAVEARLTRARTDRERLGAVNLRAKLEIEEAGTERDTLRTEKLDLEEAIAKLRKGLAALNREGRERLLAAFAQVNEHFKGLFTHLFGGGEAELRLTESDDPLEAGLEIFCQPPGKRVQTLSLLSGGEQTLTALALIFAVFLVNPAPVCVLDEVDAPLDDANVERFCALLDEMTRRSDARFLVITHHALTMSRMDRLYGVTMVERGVSKLVSVDLSAAVELVDG